MCRTFGYTISLLCKPFLVRLVQIKVNYQKICIYTHIHVNRDLNSIVAIYFLKHQFNLKTIRLGSSRPPSFTNAECNMTGIVIVIVNLLIMMPVLSQRNIGWLKLKSTAF